MGDAVSYPSANLGLFTFVLGFASVAVQVQTGEPCIILFKFAQATTSFGQAIVFMTFWRLVLPLLNETE